MLGTVYAQSVNDSEPLTKATSYYNGISLHLKTLYKYVQMLALKDLKYMLFEWF